jgi:hypothetical protein
MVCAIDDLGNSPPAKCLDLIENGPTLVVEDAEQADAARRLGFPSVVLSSPDDDGPDSLAAGDPILWLVPRNKPDSLARMKRLRDNLQKRLRAKGSQPESVSLAELPSVPHGGGLADFIGKYREGVHPQEIHDAFISESIMKEMGDRQPRPLTKTDTSVDDMPLPPAWPSIRPEAFQGLAGDLVRAVEPYTEADPISILIQFIVGFGNAVGREAYFQVEGDRHHGNLFTAIVGQSSIGRKGTSWSRARQALFLADTLWTGDNVKSGLVSGEGLIHHVRDPRDKDEGVSDKRLMIVETEFGGLLRVLKRDGSTLSPVMRNAWDGVTLSTLGKLSPAKATGAHVSIAGHITEAELRQHLIGRDGSWNSDVFNGFANRFLWICSRRARILPDGGGTVHLVGRFEARLVGAMKFAKTCGQMSRDDEAANLWRQEYPRLTAERSPDLVDAFCSRAEAQVLRLSMVYALLDSSDVIRVEHLRAALAIWDYSEQSVRRILNAAEEGRTHPKADRILEHLREHPEGATRTQIQQTVFKGHLPAGELVEALAYLRDRNLARVTKEATGRSGGACCRTMVRGCFSTSCECEKCELC